LKNEKPAYGGDLNDFVGHTQGDSKSGIISKRKRSDNSDDESDSDLENDPEVGNPRWKSKQEQEELKALNMDSHGNVKKIDAAHDTPDFKEFLKRTNESAKETIALSTMGGADRELLNTAERHMKGHHHGTNLDSTYVSNWTN
jgi:hypothetical protein